MSNGNRPLGGYDPNKAVDRQAGATAFQPKVKPGAETQAKVEGGGVEPKLAPRTMALPRISAKERPVEAGYEEHLERLEEAIEQQTAAIVEHVAEIAAEKGLDPSDVTLVWSLDITGRQDVVCSFCGRPSCTFRPVQYRTRNPEVDLLGDSIIVFQEAAARAGVKYGVIVYDEEVLVLRDPATAGDQAERADTLTRYTQFRDRHDYPDPNSQSWLQQALAKWNPADAARRVSGDPADGRMFEAAFKIFQQVGGAFKSMVVAKSVEPRGGIRGFEVRAKQAGIQMTGLAVGDRAEAVARRFLDRTLIAQDAHQLRDRVGDGVNTSLQAIKDLPAKG
jgi:hypothetical protein